MNTLGQPVWQKTSEAGQDFNFERGSLPSGIYYYKMTANGQVVQNGKLVLE